MLTDLTPERRTSRWSLPLVIVGLGAIFAGATWAGIEQREAATGPDGCFVHRPAPALQLVALDVSDPLAEANRLRVRDAIRRATAALPEGGRLVIVPLGSDASAEPVVLFNECAPVRPEDVNPLIRGGPDVPTARREFEARAAKAAGKSEALPSSDFSPIAERVETLVTFKPFVGNVAVGGARGLRVVSDGLQNSAGGSFYRGVRRIPKVSPGLLTGWSVEFVQTNNARDFALQSPEMREEWRRWFTDGGADPVTFDAAGVASPAGQGL